jgi:hypothetical protein
MTSTKVMRDTLQAVLDEYLALRADLLASQLKGNDVTEDSIVSKSRKLKDFNSDIEEIQGIINVIDYIPERTAEAREIIKRYVPSVVLPPTGDAPATAPAPSKPLKILKIRPLPKASEAAPSKASEAAPPKALKMFKIRTAPKAVEAAPSKASEAAQQAQQAQEEEEEEEEEEELVYFGERRCCGRDGNCSNKAYFNVDGKYVCGVHARKGVKTMLPKNPNAKKKKSEEIASRQILVEQAAVANRAAGRKGDVIVTKFMMRKEPEHIDGYLKVFPNFKHGGRKDGLGLPGLSPKALGPVMHKMTVLPPAVNLENYHQFAKIFPYEVDADGNLLPESLEIRMLGYTTDTPYRHKYEFPQMEALAKRQGMEAKSAPLYSLYYSETGEPRQFSYLECRYFYCHYYELLAKSRPEFTQLRARIQDGYNIQIIGFDGYPITRSLWEHYLDTGRPFGHELVLYCLLTIDDPKEYPWNMFYRKHPQLYDGFI